MNEGLGLVMIPMSILLSIIKIIFLKKKGMEVIQVDKYPVLNIVIYWIIVYVAFAIYISPKEDIYKVTEVLVWIIIFITSFYFIKNVIEQKRGFDSWILIALILCPFIILLLWLFAMCYLFIMIPINIYMIIKYFVEYDRII